ncbi:Maff2 family, partial [Dysosmobacter welbionis]
VRFKSTENSASTAPSTMVTTPRASTTVFQGSSVQNRYRQRMSTPKTPLLVRMPDSRADAGAGATGWAFGSQM